MRRWETHWPRTRACRKFCACCWQCAVCCVRDCRLIRDDEGWCWCSLNNNNIGEAGGVAMGKALATNSSLQLFVCVASEMACWACVLVHVRRLYDFVPLDHVSLTCFAWCSVAGNRFGDRALISTGVVDNKCTLVVEYVACVSMFPTWLCR